MYVTVMLRPLTEVYLKMAAAISFVEFPGVFIFQITKNCLLRKIVVQVCRVAGWKSSLKEYIIFHSSYPLGRHVYSGRQEWREGEKRFYVYFSSSWLHKHYKYDLCTFLEEFSKPASQPFWNCLRFYALLRLNSFDGFHIPGYWHNFLQTIIGHTFCTIVPQYQITTHLWPFPSNFPWPADIVNSVLRFSTSLSCRGKD